MIPPAGVHRPMHRLRHARTALLTLLGFALSLALAILLRPPARWLFPAAMSLPFFLFTLFALSEPAAAARWLLAALCIFASGFIAALFAGYLRDRRAA